MAGGLLQIASYGSQDIFLIGNPQITFFKKVFKRHTNFSMEYLEEAVDGILNFDGSFTCTISKNGDLVNKLYLKIDLPAINETLLPYNNNSNTNIINNLQSTLTALQNNYLQFTNFMTIANNIEVDIINQSNVVNNINSITVSSYINSLMIKWNYNLYLQKITSIKLDILSFNEFFNLVLNSFVYNGQNTIFISGFVDICNLILNNQSIANKTLNQTINTDISGNTISIFTYLLNFLTIYNTQVKIIDKIYLQNISYLNSKINYLKRTQLNFAWIENIGHQIIKNIEIEIGGDIVDKIDKYTMEIYKNRYMVKNKDNLYNEMIGNVEILTAYNYLNKPTYTLIIPLTFWFNRFFGSSIPCVFLRYHDIKINVTLEPLYKCCYFELPFDNTSINITNTILISNISFIVNYIYLDNDEKKKFGQYNQDYLITQMQNLLYSNINNVDINFDLPWSCSIKDFSWIITDDQNSQFNKELDFSTNIYMGILNFDACDPSTLSLINAKYKLNNKSYIKITTLFNNINNFLSDLTLIKIYKTNFYNDVYTIYNLGANVFYITGLFAFNETTCFFRTLYDDVYVTDATLFINGQNRIQKIDGIYYNLVQAYQNYPQSNPNYEISSYSFSLKPIDYNPSGFLNFSSVKNFNVSMTIDGNKIIKNTTINNNTNSNYYLNVRVYGINYNILRCIYGRAAMLFNT